MQHDSQWQAFVAHLAEREDRRRSHEAIGRVLYAVIFSVMLTFAAGLFLQYMGWL
jgi:hypothetical protein